MKLILVDPSKPAGAARLALLAARLEIERGWQKRQALAIEHLPDPLDAAVQMVERENEALVLDAACNRHAEIKAALQRIDEGTWGVCEGCGETIPPKRLTALPWASCCILCAEAAEQQEVGA